MQQEVYPDAFSSLSDDDDILVTSVFHSPRQQVKQKNSGSANPPIAAHQQMWLGSFLNRVEIEIWSNDHAMALIRFLKLGGDHPNGIDSAFGHNYWISWFWSHIDGLFSEDGPPGRYVPLSANVLVCYVGQAQVLVRSFYDQDHSNEQSSAAHKDVPEWARHFFQLFQTQENQTTNNVLIPATRNKWQPVVASLVGGQVPLGFQGNEHAQIRTETARSNDLPQMRQQIIWEIYSEKLHGADDNYLVDERDDVECHCTAPCCYNLNRVDH